MTKLWRKLLALTLLAGVVMLSPAGPAGAAGVVGDGTPESCTEAELNSALAGGGLVTFNCGPAPHAIGLKSQKVISDDTQIDGGGLITLDGQQSTRLFRVNTGVALDLQNIILRNGRATFDLGGGIYNDGGTLSLIDSSLSDNSSDEAGGGIYSINGVITITNSTINNSFADGPGGGIYSFNGDVTITNSTISDNFGSDGGGGVFSGNGNATITNSTFSGNDAFIFGGNIAVSGGSSTVAIQNTIIANGGKPARTVDNCSNSSGTISSLGGNLSDDDTCNLTEPSDLPNTPANLGPLTDNGGPTLTHLPQPGSLAIDHTSCLTPEDQRGVSRPQGSGCDVGAVERIQSGTYLLCASYYTGAVTSPLSGGCGAGTVEITPFDQTFCIDVYTSKLLYLFGRPCNPPRRAHTLPDDGDLLTCVSRYTGVNRWVRSHIQCTAFELPNTIPARP